MSILSFLLSEDELGGIYDVLTLGAYSTERSAVVLLLSKPSKNTPDLNDIYEDCFLLSLPVEVVDGIVRYAQQLHQDGPGEGPSFSVAVRNGLKPGLLSREEI